MELVTCAPTAVINPLFTLSSPPHCRHMADFATDLHMPLELVTCAPTAVINPLQYLPCGLRNGAIGWYPEQQKVWEK